MRFYMEKYPEVDDLVMVQVKQVAEMGAYVKLVSTLSSLSFLTRRRSGESRRHARTRARGSPARAAAPLFRGIPALLRPLLSL